MANNGWGNALAAVLGGYLKGRQIVNDEAAAKDNKDYLDEQRANARKDRADADSLNADLKAAGQAVAPVASSDGMLRPDRQDDLTASDPQALQDRAPMAYKVGNQSFTTQDDAQKAATAMNTPAAVGERAATAYRAHGQFDKAAALESNTRSGEMQKMQLADARWRQDLGKAMSAGHDGLAALGTSSDAGPMAGMQVKAVPSADGKTVTYVSLDKDGNAQPIPGLPAFSNDQDGVTRAAWMLDRTITPEARMQHYTTETNRKEDKEQKKAEFDATLEDRRNQHAETVRHNQAEEALTGRQIGVMASRYSNGAGTGSDAAPFDPLADFDPKQARKAAMDQAAEEAKNSAKPMSEGDIAKRVQGIYSALRTAAAAENTNMHVQSTVSAAFRKAGTDPAAYADTYAKAKQVAGPEQLAAWGYKPPGSASGSKPASPAVAASQPMAAVVGANPAPQVAPVVNSPVSASSLYARSGRAAKDAAADAQISQQVDVVARANQDPDVQALRMQLAQTSRAGDPRQVPVITQQIQNLLAQRYGL